MSLNEWRHGAVKPTALNIQSIYSEPQLMTKTGATRETHDLIINCVDRCHGTDERALQAVMIAYITELAKSVVLIHEEKGRGKAPLGGELLAFARDLGLSGGSVRELVALIARSPSLSTVVAMRVKREILAAHEHLVSLACDAKIASASSRAPVRTAMAMGRLRRSLEGTARVFNLFSTTAGTRAILTAFDRLS